ncbi:nuclease-related domain-containing DEAD/DEAH box helicase [Klebsiella quasipneumoniae]|uniref:nuclease-related domain-containing DEAD/DEAH box helicase n=1 Tax=Klebsiella quasipneumoniae TaxID=1463165 RepID=UPI00210E0355|nr:NERD domain-containing protein [Klebsiella quasipneumoniae]MCQ3858591.1 NERD domain-containing protein [Klebsiella quasipneumoniae]
MATIIPTIGSCGNKITAGEKRLARIFESNLSSDCTCWYDIPTGEKQTHPDFIILDPQRGLLFIEVKDWYISKIKSANKTHVIYETSNGDISLTHPIEQVRQYSYGAINYLKRDPQLLQDNEKYKGQFCAPYGHGVYLSNITRKQLDKYFSNSDIFPSDIVICKDEITEFMSSEEISLRLFSLVKHTFSKEISNKQVDRIRWHLYPEIRITHALDKPESSAKSISVLRTPNIIKIMDTQQELLARSLGEGHRIIHGVAGSGKTLILLYRCLHLAKDNNLKKPILVVCYNIMLAQKLKSLIKSHQLTVPLRDSKIPHYFIASSEDKKRYSPQSDFLSIIPLPSSKGLEFHSVAVIDSSNIMGNSDDLSDEIKRLYVGFTRATNNLLVTLHQKNVLSRHLTSTYNQIYNNA